MAIGRYYRAKSPAAAKRFVAELEAALQFISEYPEGAERIGPRTRSKVIRGFPYSVLYVIDSRGVNVTRIASQYRDPDAERLQ